MKNKYLALACMLIAAAFFMSGCSPDLPGPAETDLPGQETQDPGPTPTATSFQPPLTETPLPPTETPEPLALSVNGETVSLDDFNAALQQFHAGIPEASSEEAVERVMQDYTDQILLAQAAAAAGFVVDDSLVQERQAAISAEIGGEDAFAGWLAANFYSPERFERELRRAIAAAWMRDRISEDVPATAEQVRARQIRVTTRSEADSVLSQLNGGTAFDLLAEFYDPVGLGELGWFPRGYLLEPAVENAAFELETGAYSAVIETGAGFHIVQVTDRSDDRPLDPDARWALQVKAVEAWLENARAGAVVENFVR